MQSDVAVQLFRIKSRAKYCLSTLCPFMPDHSTWAFEILALRVVKQFFGLPGLARPVLQYFHCLRKEIGKKNG